MPHDDIPKYSPLWISSNVLVVHRQNGDLFPNGVVVWIARMPLTHKVPAIRTLKSRNGIWTTRLFDCVLLIFSGFPVLRLNY